MGKQYIYQIGNLTKKIGQTRVAQGDLAVVLSGAKIGVLGRNGSGKSTLLRIMAGMDKKFEGEATLTGGFTRRLRVARAAAQSGQGRFRQRRGSRHHKTRILLKRFDEINARLCRTARRPDEMEKLLAEQARVQDQIEPMNAWELDRQIEIAMDAMQLPPGDADVANRSPAASGGAWRCAKCCSRSRICCCSTSRRTISTPKAWPGSNATWPSIPARWWP